MSKEESNEKKKPAAEVEKEAADVEVVEKANEMKKKKKGVPFHEDQFVKVFLSFVILSGVINVAGALLIDPANIAAEPNATQTALGILGFLIGTAAFIMAIVAWVTWRSKEYPNAAISLAMTRVLAPIALAIVSMIAGVMYVKDNFNTFMEMEEGAEAAELALEVPAYLTVLNWVGIALSVAFIIWAVYLFTLAVKEEN